MSVRTENTPSEVAHGAQPGESHSHRGATEEDLKRAEPRLIVRTRRASPVTAKRVQYHLSAVKGDLGWDEILDEGYSNVGPLGPVYWRVVTRKGERLYLSTFLATQDQILRMWGPDALACCDPETGSAPARVETVLPSW